MPFNFYDESARALIDMSDEDAGMIVRAIMRERLDGAEPEFNGMARAVYSLIKGQVDRAEELRERSRRNGSKGGAPAGNANAEKNLKQPKTTKAKAKTNSVTETVTVTETETKENDARAARFAEFWAAYPRKTGKEAARRAFKKLRPAKELHERILRAVDEQKRGIQWLRDGGRFVPNPATWLNQGRWDDEAAEPPPVSGLPVREVAQHRYGQRDYAGGELDALIYDPGGGSP